MVRAVQVDARDRPPFAAATPVCANPSPSPRLRDYAESAITEAEGYGERGGANYTPTSLNLTGGICRKGVDAVYCPMSTVTEPNRFVNVTRCGITAFTSPEIVNGCVKTNWLPKSELDGS